MLVGKVVISPFGLGEVFARRFINSIWIQGVLMEINAKVDSAIS
jgi:hypothetical protein